MYEAELSSFSASVAQILASARREPLIRFPRRGEPLPDYLPPAPDMPEEMIRLDHQQLMEQFSSIPGLISVAMPCTSLTTPVDSQDWGFHPKSMVLDDPLTLFSAEIVSSHVFSRTNSPSLLC